MDRMETTRTRRAALAAILGAALMAWIVLTAAAFAQEGAPPAAAASGQTVRVVLQNGHVISGLLVRRDDKQAVLEIVTERSVGGRSVGRVAIPTVQILTIVEVPADPNQEWRVLLDRVRAQRAQPPADVGPEAAHPTEPVVQPEPPRTEPTPRVERPPHRYSAILERFAALPAERRGLAELPPAADIVLALPALRQEDLPNAVEALLYLNERRVVSSLQEFVGPERAHVDAAVRLAAARALVALSTSPAQYVLALQDPSPDVRLVALEKLSSESNPEYFGEVAERLLDRAGSVRQRAARMIVDLARQLDRMDLASAAAEDVLVRAPAGEIKIGVISVLEQLDYSSGAGALCGVVRTGLAQEQRAAIEALRRMRTPERLLAIRLVLQDFVATDRLDIIGEALGAVKSARDLEAVAEVIPYVDHPNASVAAAAQDVLIEVTGIRQQGLSSNDWWQHWDAIRQGMQR